MKFTEDDKELLADLRESQMWRLFEQSALELVAKAGAEVLTYAKAGASVPASFAAGRREGILEALIEVYDGNAPQFLKDLRKTV